MTLKAIEEKRAKLSCCSSSAWALDMLDEIEQEIAERYIELPVDGDGVPIRVGDTVEYLNGKRDVVRFITVNDNEPTFNEMGWIASKCRHVKPRTLEDVLKELANEVWEASCTCQATWSDSGLDGIEERYADEIRGMMA